MHYAKMQKKKGCDGTNNYPSQIYYAPSPHMRVHINM